MPSRVKDTGSEAAVTRGKPSRVLAASWSSVGRVVPVGKVLIGVDVGAGAAGTEGVASPPPPQAEISNPVVDPSAGIEITCLLFRAIMIP